MDTKHIPADTFKAACNELAAAILSDCKFNKAADQKVMAKLVDDIGFHAGAIPFLPVRRFYAATVAVYLRNASTGAGVSFAEIITQLESEQESRANLAVWQKQYDLVSNKRYAVNALADTLLNHNLQDEMLFLTRDFSERLASGAAKNVRDDAMRFAELITNLCLTGSASSRPDEIMRAAWQSGLALPVRTGYSMLDDSWNGGWLLGTMWVWGMPSGHGKSTWAVNLACERVRMELPTLINSMEMSSVDLLIRMLVNLTGLEMSQIKNPNLIQTDAENDALARGLHQLNALVRVYDSPCSVQEIGVRVRRAKAEFGPRMNFFEVDHIGIVDAANRGEQWQLLEETAYGIRAVAKATRTCGLAFSQIDEATEAELVAKNKTYRRGFRGSRGIVNAADAVVIGCRHNGIGANGKPDARYASVSVVQTQKFRDSAMSADKVYRLFRFEPSRLRILDAAP